MANATANPIFVGDNDSDDDNDFIYASLGGRNNPVANNAATRPRRTLRGNSTSSLTRPSRGHTRKLSKSRLLIATALTSLPHSVSNSV